MKAILAIPLTFFCGYSARASDCRDLLHWFKVDLKGFSSSQELLKDYARLLNLEYQRAYTPEELTYLRRRLGLGEKMQDEKIGTQFRKQISFVKKGLAKNLEEYYEEFIPGDLDLQKSMAMAREKMKILLGDDEGLTLEPARPILINFLSDEQVHFSSGMKWKMDEAMASDIYLLEAIGKRLQNTEARYRTILKRGGQEEYEAGIRTLENAVTAQDMDALRKITGQSHWPDAQLLQEGKKRLAGSSSWPFQRFETEIKNIIALQIQIEKSYGWQLDFVKENPTPQEVKKGVSVFGFKSVAPSCCLGGCQSVCPYDYGFSQKEKFKWAIRKAIMDWSPGKAPEGLQFFRIKKELQSWIDAQELVRPPSNRMMIWLYKGVR